MSEGLRDRSVPDAGPVARRVVAVVADLADIPAPSLTSRSIERLHAGLGGGVRLTIVTAAEQAGMVLGEQPGVSFHLVPPGTTLERARNLVVRSAREPYVLFLAPHAEVPPGLLTRPVQLLDQHDELSGVALGITGRPLPRVSLSALPGAPRELGPAHPEVLFAPSEAMLVRAAHFRAIGGFDERLTGGGSDLDLGWRLWIAGGCLRSCHESQVILAAAPERVASDAGPSWRRQRNALATLFKCYDDERLGAALPAALLTAPTVARPEVAARAVEEVGRWLPDLRRDRQVVQAGRRRTDQEIVRLFGQPLEALLEAGGDAEQVSIGLDLASLFGTRHRILVVTGDVLTEKMAGPAIRAWQICESLASEHDVQLATTSGTCQLVSERFRVEAAGAERMFALEQWCEVVILQGFVLLHSPALVHTQKIMLVDLYDPLHLETLELSKLDDQASRSLQVRRAVDVLNQQLLRGDFFVCASAKQRDFWLGQLAALGRVNPMTYDADPMLGQLIDVVPFGLPDEKPVVERRAIKGVIPGIGLDDEVILWGGGIYNWFDPLVLIRAVDKLRRRRPNVRLFFMGLRHPNPEVPQMHMSRAARSLADDLGLTGVHVFFNEGWVGYRDRQNYLLDSDVGVSTHLANAETAFSFRTRILDYLWAGLPIVATEGDGFADLIGSEHLGIVVPPGDVERLEAALYRILDDPAYSATCRKNVAEVRSRFTWSCVLRPLADFCRDPRRAPDLVYLDGLEPQAPIVPAHPAGPAWQRRARTALELYESDGLRGLVREVGRRVAARHVSRSL